MLRHVLFDTELFADESARKNSQKRVLVLLEALALCDQFYLQENPDTPLLYRAGIKYKLPAQFDVEKPPEVEMVRGFLDNRRASPQVQAAFKQVADIGGGEVFRETGRIYENGGGDCDNLAAARVAELRMIGIPCRPYITWRKRDDGGTTYHVIVHMDADGTSEDPSLLLGMAFPNREVDRLEEVRKLAERTDDLKAGNYASTFGASANPSLFDKAKALLALKPPAEPR